MEVTGRNIQAGEYSNFGYDTDDAKEKEIDEIINSAKAYKSELEREAYKNNYGYEENSTEDEKKKEPTAADTSETEPEKIDENEKDNAETPEKHEDRAYVLVFFRCFCVIFFVFVNFFGFSL